MQSASESRSEEEAAVESGVRFSTARRVPGALCASDDALASLPSLGVKVLRPRDRQGALRYLTSPNYDVRCAIVHPEFSRGGGFRLVAQLREMRPLLPVLMRVEKADRNLLSLAYCYGFELAIGEEQSSTVPDFVQSSLGRARTTVEQLASRVEEFAQHHSLTPSEKRIAAAAVQGLSRSELISTLDVSVNTVKSQTRSILRKTGFSSLNDLCRVVLRGIVVQRG